MSCPTCGRPTIMEDDILCAGCRKRVYACTCPPQGIQANMERPELSAAGMYSRRIYDAVEAYASDRKNRTKYDAIIEAATATANEYLAALMCSEN